MRGDFFLCIFYYVKYKNQDITVEHKLLNTLDSSYFPSALHMFDVSYENRGNTFQSTLDITYGISCNQKHGAMYFR